jgi:hypothetical protein
MTSRGKVAESKGEFGQLTFVQRSLVEKNRGDRCEVLDECVLHVCASRDVFEFLRGAELDCGKKIIEVAMTSHVVLFMGGAIDVRIETAEDSNDTKGGSKGTDRFFVGGVFRGGIERLSSIFTQDTKL